MGEHHQRDGLAAAREKLAELALHLRGKRGPPARQRTVRPHKLPAFHDPFAGGGALPLEAQRLGWSYASDLNPVAVLINKAMIEIPPKFAGEPPVNPKPAKKNRLLAEMARRARPGRGCALLRQMDARRGRKAHRPLYPKSRSPPRWQGAARLEADGRQILLSLLGCGRDGKSPNPAFAQVDVPLASTFMLSTKAGKEAYVEPVIENGGYRFTVKVGNPRMRMLRRMGPS